MKSFRQKFILFFIPPALLAIVFGTYLNFTKIEELGVRNQMVEIGAQTLTLVEAVTAIDQEARNVTREVMAKILVGEPKSDKVLLDILGTELKKSTYAGSLSLLYVDTLRTNQIVQHHIVLKQDSLALKATIPQTEIAQEVLLMTNIVMDTKSPYWTPKYKHLVGDSTATFSFYLPLMMKDKVFAIISYNLDMARTAGLFHKALKESVFNYYAFGRNAELISSYLAQDSDSKKTDSETFTHQLVVDTIQQFIAQSQESRFIDYKTIPLTKIDDMVLFGTFVNNPPIWLFFSFSKSMVRKNAWKQLRGLMLLNVIILMILVVAIITFSNKLSKPVLEMQKAVNLFLTTKRKAPIQVNRKDELGLLAQELNLMQDELIQKEQEVRKLDDAKDSFLKMISHEIRTPLNGILGSAYFLKESIEHEDLSEFVDMLAESADRLDHLSRKALTITELQTKETLTMEDQVNLYDFLHETTRQNSNMIHRDHISITTPQKAICLKMNKLLVSEAVSEIIHNTVRFADQNTGLSINISSAASGTKIDFENTGPLIPVEKLARLAKPFELGQEHYDKYTGLGLALVSIIMRLHNGELMLENTETGVKTSLFFASTR